MIVLHFNFKRLSSVSLIAIILNAQIFEFSSFISKIKDFSSKVLFFPLINCIFSNLSLLRIFKILSVQERNKEKKN